MQMTRIIAVRHGETAWNVDARIQGSLDIPLNAKGVWQATRAGQALAGESVDMIYASDLARAHATALEIGRPHQLTPIAHKGLRERVFGEFQGKTFEEVQKQWPDKAARWRHRDPAFAPEGGESLLQFRERVVTTARHLAHAHIGKTLIWVAHGGVMDVLYREATGQDLLAPRTWALGNAAINRLLWNGEHFTLVGWDDTSHLDESVRSDQAV